MREASAISRRDPDAAALLSAQAAQSRGSSYAASLAYDPIDIYTRLAREFGWSDVAMDGMDYVRFFGYVDRLTRQHERERAENDARARGGASYGDAGTVAAAFPEPRVYEGRTVTYG